MSSFATYLIWLAVFGLVLTALWGLRERRMSAVPVVWLLGLAGGLIGSKLVYYITQMEFVMYAGWIRSIYDTNLECWSFFGGALGASLGVALAGKLSGLRPMTMLNSFAPFGALMAAAARFGYLLLEEDMVGFGSYADQVRPFLTVTNEWNEAYWAVYRMEGAWALLIAVLCIVFFKKDAFLRVIFYLCLGQIFFESLHSDSLRWLFVRIEQLASMITLEAVLVHHCLRLGKPCLKHFTAALIGLVCAGLFVGVEFALDKTGWPVPVIYGTMLFGMAVLAVTEIMSHRRLKTE